MGIARADLRLVGVLQALRQGEEPGHVLVKARRGPAKLHAGHRIGKAARNPGPGKELARKVEVDDRLRAAPQAQRRGPAGEKQAVVRAEHRDLHLGLARHRLVERPRLPAAEGQRVQVHGRAPPAPEQAVEPEPAVAPALVPLAAVVGVLDRAGQQRKGIVRPDAQHRLVRQVQVSAQAGSQGVELRPPPRGPARRAADVIIVEVLHVGEDRADRLRPPGAVLARHEEERARQARRGQRQGQGLAVAPGQAVLPEARHGPGQAEHRPAQRAEQHALGRGQVRKVGRKAQRQRVERGKGHGQPVPRQGVEGQRHRQRAQPEHGQAQGLQVPARGQARRNPRPGAHQVRAHGLPARLQRPQAEGRARAERQSRQHPPPPPRSQAQERLPRGKGQAHAQALRLPREEERQADAPGREQRGRQRVQQAGRVRPPSPLPHCAPPPIAAARSGAVRTA